MLQLRPHGRHLQCAASLPLKIFVMITPVTTEDTSSSAAAAAALAVATASVGKKAGLLSLAGDALCLAVTTALRLTESPATHIASDDDKEENLPVIPLDQVSWHDNNTDCWVVVYDRVYDITEFLWQHPGGEEILLEYAGRDATLAFRGIGHGPAMLQAMERYLLGILPMEERIYSVPGGKLSGLCP